VHVTESTPLKMYHILWWTWRKCCVC